MATNIPQAILKQARKSGFLNLSNRDLESVPPEVWKLNAPPSKDDKEASSFDSDDRWWEQVELTKLNLSSNRITSLSGEIKNFLRLTVLDVHDNKLTSLPSAISELTKLKHVDLSHNNLKTLPSLESFQSVSVLLLHYNQLSELPSSVGALKSCEALDVSNNAITRVSSDIDHLYSLRSLNISNNRLSSLPSIGNMRSLKMLSLNNNALKSLPGEMEKLVNLEQLYIRNNSIVALPNLKSCSGLKEVYVGNNALKAVPEHLPDCVAVLELRDNKIDSVTIDITRISNLERLDIANNNISQLPPEIGNMNRIKVLVLDGNPLRSIRRDIINQGTQAVLKHLKSRIIVTEESSGRTPQQSALPQSDTHSELARKHNISNTCKLNLSKGNLESVERGLEDASGVALLEMDLSRCTLAAIPSPVFNFAATLTSFNASSNKLKNLQSAIGTMNLITHLDLSSNLLTGLPAQLGNLQALIEINVSSNKFVEIPSCLYEVENLEHLLADSNQIKSIDVSNLKRLKKLSILSLQYNSIDQVPPELASLEKLQTLKLEGNLFRVPRQSVMQKGSAAVLEYLRSRIPT